MPPKMPLPQNISGMVIPFYLKALGKYEETGIFKLQGQEPQEFPTKAHLKFIGFDNAFISTYYPVKSHQIITCRLNMQAINYVDLALSLKNMSYKWLEDAHLILEAHSKDCTPNLHFHLLISPAANKTQIIRDLTRRFKIPKPSVDVKLSDDPELYQTRNAYVAGVKQDKKLDAVCADVKFFEEKDVVRFYHYVNGKYNEE